MLPLPRDRDQAFALLARLVREFVSAVVAHCRPVGNGALESDAYLESIADRWELVLAAVAVTSLFVPGDELTMIPTGCGGSMSALRPGALRDAFDAVQALSEASPASPRQGSGPLRVEERTLSRLLDLADRISPATGGAPPAPTGRLLSVAVVTKRFDVSKRTVLRAVKDKRLHDHRLPGATRNAPLRLDETEVAALWPRRG